MPSSLVDELAQKDFVWSRWFQLYEWESRQKSLHKELNLYMQVMSNNVYNKLFSELGTSVYVQKLKT